MDIVLGVSVAPSTVQIVLVEGEGGDGVTIEQDDFAVDGPGIELPDRVISAILGTREGAQEGGYRLTSTGVVVDDQSQAQQLRTALTARRMPNVTLVSAFLAAAALAQAVGGAVGYLRTALLFVEPATATLAVINSADGAITEVHRVRLRGDAAETTSELVALAAGVDGLAARPDGLFVVGSGVDVGMVKPVLDAASPIPVSAPEEPQTALARGAALASAHAPLFESATAAVAWARDPGTGVVDRDRMAFGYAHLPPVPIDYEATVGVPALAYSAVGSDDQTGVDPAQTTRLRRPILLAGSALAALFVAVAATLVIALTVGVRPIAAHQTIPQPVPRPHVVVPAEPAPAPAPQPQAEQPAPAALPPARPPAPPPAAPAPVPPTPAPPPAAAPSAPSAPEPTSAPVPAAHQAPTPAVVVPEVVPAAPAPPPPAPAPVAPIPIPIPILLPAPVPAAPPSAPGLPPIFKPPQQTAPKTGGGHDGGAPGWPGRGAGGDAGMPGRSGGKGGGGLFPGWPGAGGERRGGLPGLFGGHGGLPF